MENDDFAATTTSFLAWLSQVGIQISPKIAVEDMRESGKNRGIGELPFHISHTAAIVCVPHAYADTYMSILDTVYCSILSHNVLLC